MRAFLFWFVLGALVTGWALSHDHCIQRVGPSSIEFRDCPKPTPDTRTPVYTRPIYPGYPMYPPMYPPQY